ncbi:MAG: hypothetical protein COB46_08990 [Rhodospirillaceae bacterium]|nr:MAG: hypothetical protein COB46_08990 [Rhodospirillaceae bacterium]
MTVFTAHLQDSATDYNLILIKDGFSFPAAIFGFIWALVIGAWELALALLVFQLALSAALPLLIEDAAALGVVQFGAAVLVGFVANEGRRMVLSRREFDEIGVVTGHNKLGAERRFLDAHPYVTTQLLEFS